MKNYRKKLENKNITDHLKCSNEGQCLPPTDKDCVRVRGYDTFFTDLKNLPGKTILPENVNLRVFKTAGVSQF